MAVMGMRDHENHHHHHDDLVKKKPNPNKPTRMTVRFNGTIINTLIFCPNSPTFCTGKPGTDRYKPHPLFPNLPSSIPQTQIIKTNTNTTNPNLDDVSTTTTEEVKGQDHDYESKLNLSKRKLREGYQELNRAKKQRQIVVLDNPIPKSRASQCARFKSKKLQRLYTNHKLWLDMFGD